jgi:hypothetical protein
MGSKNGIRWIFKGLNWGRILLYSIVLLSSPFALRKKKSPLLSPLERKRPREGILFLKKIKIQDLTPRFAGWNFDRIFSGWKEQESWKAGNEEEE